DVALGCRGALLSDVLQQVASFLRGPGSRETVILYFSHPCSAVCDAKLFGYDTTQQNAIVEQTVQLVSQMLAGLLFSGPASTVLADLPLSSTAGKAIAAFSSEFAVHLSPTTGIWPWNPWAQGTPNTTPGLTVFDQYTGSPDMPTVMSDQLAKLSAWGGVGQPFLFLASWTCTGSGTDSAGLPTLTDLPSLAGRCNGGLGGGLIEGVRAGRKRPNLVNLDYWDAWLGRAVVRLNYV
ncbi:hypothetical protein DFJ74DRAFT_644177, partial [Hyaloraphidium curvatum]